MIRPSKLPMVSVLAMHGAQLVDSINPPDPTRGAAPYRNVGLPSFSRLRQKVIGIRHFIDMPAWT